MTALLYIPAVALLVATIYCGRIAFDFGPHDDLAMGGAMLCGLSTLALFIIPTVILPARAIGRSTCHNWGEQTGYRTKFTVLNWADTGTCLAQTSDGHWVPNTHIIINTPPRP